MFNPETPPEFAITGWLNAPEPLSLARLRDRVVVVLAFQMLCPSCVEHAIPQAKRLRARFNPDQVAIVGLHSVFENHQAMTPTSLEVFVRQYELPFPVAIDAPALDSDGATSERGAVGVPQTMAAYQMQGTPTLLIFDRAGRLRRHYFGKPDDIMLAAEIMALAIEEKGSPRNEAARIERKIVATLVGDAPDHDHHHDLDGHEPHGHAHGHDHGDGCGCGHDHDNDHHAETHEHDGHSHGHHRHAHDHMPVHDQRARDPREGQPSPRLVEAERMTEPPRDLKPGS